MLVDSGRLHIAVQKSGRLADYSRGLLRDAGLKIQNGKNALTARVDNFPIDLMFVRDDDIPTFVADGVCEFGMVGRNVLEEFALDQPEARFEVIAPLGFGRCALKIAAPEATPYRGPESLAGARVATSYPRLTRRFLDERGIDATVVRMNGAVELAPRLGIAGFICDLVSTGATLEANGLVPVETVMESEAVLVRTLKPLSAAKQGLSDNLWRRIEGVLATQESKYIMLNAPEEALDAIAAILPGAESPTIIPLAGRAGHFAVHAVCQESVFWETLEKLKAAGASAILVMPIEKMMM
ncbi:ATP phosphoribosyltransferase [Sphingosinicella ginsenosidimutans]|uniref:ATP phosphoribosyltransferase n=1 Tax=Allosphingosinicella ginsenosidimutans TaxID=1176539 RepID=A0A5C6TUL1_9SPHN|nr:ATP phosphoribosyltransferase [Sphingosinicella ginsenosidimutans]TXC64143.1 ATP phosphoribosyltransferase [Sphingosinicella ginsenosidimutans]